MNGTQFGAGGGHHGGRGRRMIAELLNVAEAGQDATN